MTQDETRAKVRGHLRIFGALLVLTLVSAGATIAGAGAGAGMAIALAIACIQVYLVSRFLMHVWEEKKAVRVLLGFTVFFVAALFALELVAGNDRIEGTESIAPAVAAEKSGHENSEH